MVMVVEMVVMVMGSMMTIIQKSYHMMITYGDEGNHMNMAMLVEGVTSRVADHICGGCGPPSENGHTVSTLVKHCICICICI